MLSLSSSLVDELSQAVLRKTQTTDLTKQRRPSEIIHKPATKTRSPTPDEFSISTVVPISDLSTRLAGLDSETTALSLTINFIIASMHGAVDSDIKPLSFLSRRFEIKQVTADGVANKPYPIQFGDEILMSGVILNAINENTKDVVLKAPFSN